jgi:hypothetical protein
MGQEGYKIQNKWEDVVFSGRINLFQSYMSHDTQSSVAAM